MPHPSERTKPSADSEKVLQRPSPESMRACDSVTDSCGTRIALTPPARAIRHSPCRRLWQARWIATAEDEHAVSIDIFGPFSPKMYESRPAAIERATPVPE